MGFRTVNGSTHTENGWRCCNVDECAKPNIPDLYQIDAAWLRKGAPLITLGAWIFWYDRNVEEIFTPVWAWSKDNDVLGGWGKNNGSNHLSGTAIDIQAPKHPWKKYTMSKEKIAKIEEGLRLFSLTGKLEDSQIFWGGWWPAAYVDQMHFQMRYPEGDKRNEEFAQKLLDGYLGIYKAGPSKPETPDNATIFSQAFGVSVAKAREILPIFIQGAKLAGIKTNNQLAMFGAQLRHESDQFRTTEEYKKNGRYAPYIGRTWIQITWESNYRKFNQWAFEQGLVDSATFFVDHPQSLADLKWAGVGSGWYWKYERPRLNALAEAGDIEEASRQINGTNPDTGRANHIKERIDYWNQARKVNLLPLLATDGGDDPLAGVDVDRLNKAVDKILGTSSLPQWPSRSMFAEGRGGVDDTVGMLLNVDGNIWNLVVVVGFLLGVEEDVALVKKAAAGELDNWASDNEWLQKRTVEFATKLLPLAGILGLITIEEETEDDQR